MMRSRFRLGRLAQSCGLALAVAVIPTCSDPDEGVLVQVTSAINPGGGCMTLPPDRLMTAPGQFVTDANYDHSTCPRGYLINFDRYPVNHNAIAAFAGPVPTNEGDCTRAKITAYVWRRTSTGVTFINSAERSGTWARDIRGVSHCAPPVMNIEQAVPGFRGNGSDNFRIGLQARINDASGGAAVIHKIGFSTPNVSIQGAKDMLRDLKDLDTRVRSQQTSGVMNPTIASVFARKGTYLVDVACRHLQLERAVTKFSRQALLRAGGSSTGTADMAAGLDQMSTGLCTAAGTANDLRAGILRYTGGIDATRASIRTRFANVFDPDELTAGLIGGITEESYGMLASNCGLTTNTLLGYLYDGALPSGVTADKLVFGSCRNMGADPAGIAVALGFGAPFGGQTDASARTKFQACLVDSGGHDNCNDPRAQAAPAATDPNQSTTPDTCWITPENRPCNTAEQQRFDQEKDAQAQSKATGNQMVVKGAEAAPATSAKNPAADAAAVQTFGQAAAWVAGGIAYLGSTLRLYVATEKAIEGGVALLSVEGAGLAVSWIGAVAVPTAGAILVCTNSETCNQAVRRGCSDFLGGPQACPTAPTGGDNYCPSEFGSAGGWYETDGPPGRTQQLTQPDRFQHCLCQFLDDVYSGAPGANGLAPLGCPSKTERLRQDCLLNPQDAQDRPRRECLTVLSPPADVSVWQAKICQQIRCPNTNDTKKTNDDGSCSCVPQLAVDTGQGLPCRNGSYAYCDAGSTATQCGCVPADPGPPIGDNPFCSFAMDAASWPGSIDAFLVRNVNDATIHQHDATNRFVMIKPDQSAVSPLIYRNSLAEVPAPGGTTLAKWRVRTLISQRPAGSDNIDLQLYATSFGMPSGTQPLVHDFLGQVRLNTLQPGVPTDVEIPLNQSLINRAFAGSGVRLEYTIQAADSYARRVGIGAQSIVGNKTIIPVGSRAPFCPRPAPDNNITLVTAPNPTFTAGVTPTNPLVTFPLSSGLTATVPPRLIELLPKIR